MTVREESRGIGDLLGDLGGQVSTLVRREIDLARVEVTASASRMGQGAATAGAGGVLLHAGLLFVLAAVVLGLIELGLDPWLATLIVGAAVALVGGLLVSSGVSRIRETNLAPTETVETVRENVEYVKEQIK